MNLCRAAGEEELEERGFDGLVQVEVEQGWLGGSGARHQSLDQRLDYFIVW